MGDANRRRNLLHRSKLDDFLSWAIAQGYARIPRRKVMASYEVAYLTKPGLKAPIVIYDRNGGDHLTTFGAGTSLVKRWIEARA